MGGANSFYAMMAIFLFLAAVWGSAKVAKLVGISSIVLQIATGTLLSPSILSLLPAEYSVCEHRKFDAAKCDEEERGQQPIADEGTIYCDCAAYEASDKMTEGWLCDGHSGLWSADRRRVLEATTLHPDHHQLKERVARRLASTGHEGETVYDDYGTCLTKNCEKVVASMCAETPEVFSLVGQIGVALMIFESGMHFDFEKSRTVGGRAVAVAIAGTLLPLVSGAALTVAFGYTLMYEGIAAGTALAPTSVGIALTLLHEAKQLQTDHGQVIIAAAFVDDIFSLILFNFVFSLADGFSIMECVVKPILGVVFMICTSLLGVKFWPWVFSKLGAAMDLHEESCPNSTFVEFMHRFSSLKAKDAMMFICQMMLLMGYAAVTNLCGTHLWGCFIAGMSFAQVNNGHHIWVNQTKRLTVWMLRLFFACSVAFTIPLDELLNPKAFWQGLIMGLGPCILSKVFCAVCMGPPRFVIGWAMVGRAEFAYLIAQTAFSSNMMTPDVYSLTIWALLWATIVAPLMFRFVLARYAKFHVTPPTPEEQEQLEQDPAYLKVSEGLSELYAVRKSSKDSAASSRTSRDRVRQRSTCEMATQTEPEQFLRAGVELQL